MCRFISGSKGFASNGPDGNSLLTTSEANSHGTTLDNHGKIKLFAETAHHG